ncbi:MAG: hypothetical protein ACJAS0_002752 [Alcanivorax borkumensis]|jgi:hypothetical protein
MPTDMDYCRGSNLILGFSYDTLKYINALKLNDACLLKCRVRLNCL